MVVGVLRNNGMASCHADYTAFIPRQKEVDRLIVYVGFSSKLCESAMRLFPISKKGDARIALLLQRNLYWEVIRARKLNWSSKLQDEKCNLGIHPLRSRPNVKASMSLCDSNQRFRRYQATDSCTIYTQRAATVTEHSRDGSTARYRCRLLLPASILA